MLNGGSAKIDSIPKIVKKYATNGSFRPINTVISSVVPGYISFLKKSFAQLKDIRLWVAGRNLPVPVNSNYKHNNKLGIDRAVNAYGASQIYVNPLVVIDIGTAITADFISKKGVFEGGLIIPGPQISFEALKARTALLPKNLAFPVKSDGFLGKSTSECMSSGVLQGFGAMLDGLIDRFRSQYGSALRIIVTGGYSSILRKYSHSRFTLNPDLSIQSLLLLYKSKSR